MKLCKDCKHFHRPLLDRVFAIPTELARCRRDEYVAASPVNGRTTYKESFCYTERLFDHCCGPVGKFWSAK